MHVARHRQRETVAASPPDEQVDSVPHRVNLGEVRQVEPSSDVVDTDGREEQSWEGASPILTVTEALESDLTKQDSSTLAGDV